MDVKQKSPDLEQIENKNSGISIANGLQSGATKLEK
jgi:hypothetical protein